MASTAPVGAILSLLSIGQFEVQARSLTTPARQALFLPEATDYIAPDAATSICLARPLQTSPFVLGIREQAQKHRLPISVGIHEPAYVDPNDEGGVEENGQKKKVKNALIWVDENGDVTQRYQKLHLFDVEVEGGPVIRESRSTEEGKAVTRPFDTIVGRVGMMICFDVSSLCMCRLNLSDN